MLGALLGSLGELVVRFAIGSWLLHRMTPFNPYGVWMEPLGNFLVLTPLVAVVGITASAVWGAERSLLAMRACALAGATWATLLAIDRIHPLALAVLAVGVGVRAATWAASPRRGRILGLGTAALGLVALVGGVAYPLWRQLAFRAAVGAAPAAPSGAPNVLLLILDTVGAREMSLYGYPRRTTPTIDSLAREAIVFDNAVAPAPWTLPSHASMFSGRPPRELSARFQRPLDGTAPLLAERFAQAGYATAGFVANQEYTASHTGLDRGFMWYEDHRPSVTGSLEATPLGRRALALLGRMRGRPVEPARKGAEEVSHELLEWMPSAGDRPIFAFLNFYDAHGPYVPSVQGERRFLDTRDTLRYFIEQVRPSDSGAVRGARAAHDAAIFELDAAIGRLLTVLERGRATRPLIVVIASDHGEEFAEHGVLEHANSLYWPSLHVPLLIMLPGKAHGGRRIDAPVSMTNLAATLLTLAGIPPAPLAGVSLSSLWEDTPAVRDSTAPAAAASWVERGIRQPAAYPSSQGELQSVVLDSLHLIEGRGVELYNIRVDPLEARNLAGDSARADQLRRLQGLLRNR